MTDNLDTSPTPSRERDTPPREGTGLAAHMKLVYQVYYFPKDFRPYLVTQEQPYMDVRHIVRTRLAEIHDAGPTQVARVEFTIRGARDEMSPNAYQAIIHSRKVVNDWLRPHKPLLVKRVDRLIKSTKCKVLSVK